MLPRRQPLPGLVHSHQRISSHRVGIGQLRPVQPDLTAAAGQPDPRFQDAALKDALGQVLLRPVEIQGTAAAVPGGHKIPGLLPENGPVLLQQPRRRSVRGQSRQLRPGKLHPQLSTLPHGHGDILPRQHQLRRTPSDGKRHAALPGLPGPGVLHGGLHRLVRHPDLHGRLGHVRPRRRRQLLHGPPQLRIVSAAGAEAVGHVHAGGVAEHRQGGKLHALLPRSAVIGGKFLRRQRVISHAAVVPVDGQHRQVPRLRGRGGFRRAACQRPGSRRQQQTRCRRGQRLPPRPPPGPGGLGLLQKLLGQFIHGVAELFRVHTSKPSFSRYVRSPWRVRYS